MIKSKMKIMLNINLFIFGKKFCFYIIFYKLYKYIYLLYIYKYYKLNEKINYY